MPQPPDDPASPASGSRPRRERSTRYPGVSLAESVKLCESILALGVDGMTAVDIATALGYKNIKTNTFSSRLSAARQFGLLNLKAEQYELTPLAQAIVRPVDPSVLPRLYRQALFKPPLYGELAQRLAGKRVPDPEILGNVLYHHHQIIATAKRAAAEAFLESSRFAGVLGDDQVYSPDGPADPPAPSKTAPAERRKTSEVRLDLRLWDRDEGKTIRVRAPQSITAASFERFLQAFRLLVKIDD